MEDREKARIRGLLTILGGLLCVVLFWAVGRVELDGYRLGVGSIGLPRPRLAYFVAFWTFFGSAAAVLITVGLARVLKASTGLDIPFGSGLELPHDRTIVLAGFGLALLFPVALRLFVLEGASVTDDESAYRFMAQLIASGQLAAESPPAPLKLFFDRFQMVNDGSRYAQYFVGWPALMAPGVWLGVEEWMNALYSALAIPALYGTARRLADRWGSVFATVLYVTSPFVIAAAATLGSHTSCLTALAWCYWAYFRSSAEDASAFDDALFATAFSIAFFIRPLAALGLGGPLVAIWAWRRFRNDSNPPWRRLAAFAAPAVCFAALFLWVNYVQTGSPFTVAYSAFLEYGQQNGGRFTGTPAEHASGIPNLGPSGILESLSIVGTGLLRFDVALFGWPISLVFVLFAGVDEKTRSIWLSALGYLGTRFALRDPGIDLFGPVHFAELALPAILLSAVGIRRLTSLLGSVEWSDSGDDNRATVAWPGIYLCSALVLTIGCYLPVRYGALADVADNTRLARSAVRAADIDDAVVFAPRPFIPNCLEEGARHFVFWRPLNHPDLSSDILWVNHVTLEDDRTFMKYAPERDGYLLAWGDECTPHLVPLDREDAKRIPDGHIGGTGEGPDWTGAPSPEDYQLPEPHD